MKYLRICKWEDHQHYKHRDPKWIKVHRLLLDDYEFGQLADKDKAHLVCLWLLAAKLDNKIPGDPAWIEKQIGANTEVDYKALISAGFIESYEDASKTLAECTTSVPSCTTLVEESRVEERKKVGKPTWLTPFAKLWEETIGEFNYEKAAKPLKALRDKYGSPAVEAAFAVYVKKADHKYACAAQFKERYLTWTKPQRRGPVI